MRKQLGISLVEVLVTLLLSSIGLLGLASLQLQALQATLDSAQRSQAAWLMYDLTERMRASAQADNAAFQVGVSCGSLPKMCAAQMTAAGLQAASDCSASEMALFSLWEANCAYSDLAGQQDSRSSSRDSVIVDRDGGSSQLVKLSANGAGVIAEASWLLKTVRNQESTKLQLGMGHRQEILR